MPERVLSEPWRSFLHDLDARFSRLERDLDHRLGDSIEPGHVEHVVGLESQHVIRREFVAVRQDVSPSAALVVQPEGKLSRRESRQSCLHTLERGEVACTNTTTSASSVSCSGRSSNKSSGTSAPMMQKRTSSARSPWTSAIKTRSTEESSSGKVEHQWQYQFGRFVRLLIVAVPKFRIHQHQWRHRRLRTAGIALQCHRSRRFDHLQVTGYRRLDLQFTQQCRLVEPIRRGIELGLIRTEGEDP